VAGAAVAGASVAGAAVAGASVAGAAVETSWVVGAAVDCSCVVGATVEGSSVVGAGVVVSYAGSQPAFHGLMHSSSVGLKCSPFLQANFAEKKKLHFEYLVQSFGSGTFTEFIVTSGGQSGLPGPKPNGLACALSANKAIPKKIFIFEGSVVRLEGSSCKNSTKSGKSQSKSRRR
jgi:hypothetical protein